MDIPKETHIEMVGNFMENYMGKTCKDLRDN